MTFGSLRGVDFKLLRRSRSRTSISLLSETFVLWKKQPPNWRSLDLKESITSPFIVTLSEAACCGHRRHNAYFLLKCNRCFSTFSLTGNRAKQSERSWRSAKWYESGGGRTWGTETDACWSAEAEWCKRCICALLSLSCCDALAFQYGIFFISEHLIGDTIGEWFPH